MFGPGTSAAGRISMPGDWAPPVSNSREPSPQNRLSEINNLDVSPSIHGFRTSSRNASGEVAVPILHSSNESNGSRPAPSGRLLTEEHREGDLNQLGFEDDRAREAENVEQAIDAQVEVARARSYRHPLPMPRAWDGKGERDIKQFFKVYEKYCSSMWGYNRSDWISGLETLLKGWALHLYSNLVNQGKSYESIKLALQNAFPAAVDPFRTKNLIKLLNLKKELGEPLPVFFMRVDTLIRETYPHLEERSAKIQCRDTFLMKLDAETASKIANYCNTRNNFEPSMVQEAAVMVGSPDFLNTSPGATSSSDIFLVQPNELQKTKAMQQNQKETEMRCLLCAGSWHPVSACILYATIFTCPLCREDPHPITECRLYSEWNQFRKVVPQNRNGQWSDNHQTNRYHQIRRTSWTSRNEVPDATWRQNANRYAPREDRTGYMNTRTNTFNQGRPPYPNDSRQRSLSRSGDREGPGDRRRELGDYQEDYRRGQPRERHHTERLTDRLPAYREPYRYNRNSNNGRQGNF